MELTAGRGMRSSVNDDPFSLVDASPETSACNKSVKCSSLCRDLDFFLSEGALKEETPWLKRISNQRTEDVTRAGFASWIDSRVMTEQSRTSVKSSRSKLTAKKK